MNQYLKYFIYFLLGVIIYYFLFNSPNAKAQKLIEGFEVGDPTEKAGAIFVKNGTLVLNNQLLDGSGVPLTNISVDNITRDPSKSIFKSLFLTAKVTEDLNDEIFQANNSQSSLFRNTFMKNTRLPNPIAPPSFTINFGLNDMQGNLEHASEVFTMNIYDNIGPNYLSAINQLLDNAVITNDNSLIYFKGDLPASDLGSGADLPAENLILIFKFIETDNQKLFSTVDIYIIIPTELEDSEGDSEVKFLGPPTATKTEGTEPNGTRLSNNHDSLGSGNKKSGNFYVIKQIISHIGFLSPTEPLRLSQIAKYTGDEENYNTKGQIQYNFELTFLDLISISLPLPHGEPTINPIRLEVIDVDEGTASARSYLASVETLDATTQTLLKATPTAKYTVKENGVVVAADETTTSPAEVTVDLSMDIRSNYQYEANVEINIFQYVYFYFEIERVRSHVEDHDDPVRERLNSIFLDMRIFNVDAEGKFGSQRGCAGGANDVQHICDTIATRERKTPGIYRAMTPLEGTLNTTCDPNPEGSIASLATGNTGSCYANPDLCCTNMSCIDWLTVEAHQQQCADDGRGLNTAGIPTVSGPSVATCCGIKLHGYLSVLFNRIKTFGDKLFADGYDGAEEKTTSPFRIHRNYIKYFILYNSLDFSKQKTKGGAAITDKDNLKPNHYEELIHYISDGIDITYADVGVTGTNIKIIANSQHPTILARNKIFPPGTEKTGTYTDTYDAVINETPTSNLSELLEHIELNTEIPDSETFATTTGKFDATPITVALQPDKGPMQSLETVVDNYKHFMNFFGTQRDGTGFDGAKIATNIKLNLALMNKVMPHAVMPGGETPLTKAFPEATYNLSTFSIYL